MSFFDDDAPSAISALCVAAFSGKRTNSTSPGPLQRRVWRRCFSAVTASSRGDGEGA
jgi:hypothetical protein